MSITRLELQNYLDGMLRVSEISDYCPNGLQVEGASKIEKIVTGVTASQALVDAAIEAKADALIVHHGYFWKGESQVIAGMKKRRLQALLLNDINLFAYHLPLDVHPEFGNNRQLASLLGIQNISAVSGVKPVGVVMHGNFEEEIEGSALQVKLQKLLGRDVLIEGPVSNLYRSLLGAREVDKGSSNKRLNWALMHLLPEKCLNKLYTRQGKWG